MLANGGYVHWSEPNYRNKFKKQRPVVCIVQVNVAWYYVIE
jgi:hypothetical protein